MNITLNFDNPSTVFLIAFLPCFLLFFIQMTIFLCLRKKFVKIYNPRGLYNLGPFNHNFTNLSNKEWLRRMLSLDDNKIFEYTGFDGLLIVRFSRLLVIISMIIMVLGLIFILPIHLTGDMNMEDFFNQASLSNVSTNSDRLWSHFLFLWIFSFIIYAVLFREWSILINYKLISDQRDIYSSNSFIMCNFSKDLNEKEYRVLPHDRRIYDLIESLVDRNEFIIYNFPYLDNFMRLIEKHDRLILKLHQESWNESLDNPNSDKIANLLKILHTNYKMLQEEQKCHNELTDVFLIVFRKSTKCIFVKNTFHEMNSNYEPKIIDPSSLILKNFNSTFDEKMIRSILINILMIGLLLVWIGPLTGIVSLTKLETLGRQFSNSTVDSIPIVIIRFSEGLLPIIILGLVYIFIYKLLYFFESFKKPVSKDKLDLLVCRDMIIFMIVDSFLFFVISGSVLQNLKEIVEKPLEIPIKLAMALPSQANFFIVQIMAFSFVLHPWEMLRFLRYPFVYKIPFLKIKSDLKCLLNTFPEEPYYAQLYARYILIYTVGLTYSLLSPMILPFWFLYFVSGHIEMVFNVTHIHEASYKYRGKFWPLVFNGIMAGLLIAQLMIIGVVILRKNSLIAGLCSPLPFISLIVWIYLREKYLKRFSNVNIESAKIIGDLTDEKMNDFLRSYMYSYEIPSITFMSKFKYPNKYRKDLNIQI